MVLVSQTSTSVKTQCLSTRMRGPQSAITGGQALGSQECVSWPPPAFLYVRDCT